MSNALAEKLRNVSNDKMNYFGEEKELVLDENAVLEEEVVEPAEVVKEEAPALYVVNNTPKDSKSYISSSIVSSEEKASGLGVHKVDTLLQTLNLSKEDLKSVKVLHLSDTDVTPVEGVVTKDNSGRVSSIIETYQTLHGIHIVPAEITNVPDWVTPLEHERFSLFGKTYFYPVVNKGASDRVHSFVDDCVRELSNCNAVVVSLFHPFVHEGKDVRTLKFTQAELADIVTYLKNYDAKVIEVADKDLILLAGDYIHG